MKRDFILSIKKLLLISKVEITPLLSTYLYLLVSVASPSRRVFFIISFIYFVYLVYSTNSINKAIIFSFFPLWLFNVGREFLFVVVPREAIKSPLYWEGRTISFSLSPFFIISIITISIVYIYVFRYILLAMINSAFYHKISHFIRDIFRRHNRQKEFKMRKNNTQLFINKYLLFFLIMFALFFISSASSTYFAGLSFLYTVIEFSFFAWLILAIMTLRSFSKKKIESVLITLLLILFGMLVLESSITYLQTFKRGVLGLTIEKVSTIPSFGFGADENQLQFRPVGLSYHANSLANWQISLLSTIILLWLTVKNILPKNVSNFLIVTSIGLSISVIVLTLSRSAYLSLFLFALIFILFSFKTSLRAMRFALGYLQKFKIPLLVIFVYFIFMISDRALNTLFTLGETGGLKTRQVQINEAIQVLRSSPYLGVGNGMFISASYDFNPEGVIRYFPEYVHNGFILFLAERGFIAGVAYLLGLYFLLRSVTFSFFSKNFRLIIVGGIMANYVMMLFQPFVNFLSLNILITGLLVEIKNHGERYS